MKKIIVIFFILGFVSLNSCKRKSCPAYDENPQDNTDKMLKKKHKRKKAKLF